MGCRLDTSQIASYEMKILDAWKPSSSWLLGFDLWPADPDPLLSLRTAHVVNGVRLSDYSNSALPQSVEARIGACRCRPANTGGHTYLHEPFRACPVFRVHPSLGMRGLLTIEPAPPSPWAFRRSIDNILAYGCVTCMWLTCLETG